MTRRRDAAVARGLAALVVAVGCASQTTWITPPAPVTAGPINGLLLDGRNRPLPGQIVAVGGEKTTSDPEGRFAFATTVPVTYDLVIASLDRGLATDYQGLTRPIRSSWSGGVRPRADPQGDDCRDASGCRLPLQGRWLT